MKEEARLFDLGGRHYSPVDHTDAVFLRGQPRGGRHSPGDRRLVPRGRGLGLLLRQWSRENDQQGQDRVNENHFHPNLWSAH